jgi:hypothetical protein
MPIVEDDSQVKRQTQFLEYEVGDMGNQLILKSRLYQIPTHYLNSVKRGVLCKGDGCLYCAAHYQKKIEYHYMVFLNGQVGYIDVKASVFFDIQGIAKAQRKDPRQISWTVIKQGSGLDTTYTTSKDDNLSQEDFERTASELEANTQRLVDVMEAREDDLGAKYVQYLSEIREQKAPGSKKAADALAAQAPVTPVASEAPAVDVHDNTPPVDDPEQKVDPDEIPF